MPTTEAERRIELLSEGYEPSVVPFHYPTMESYTNPKAYVRLMMITLPLRLNIVKRVYVIRISAPAGGIEPLRDWFGISCRAMRLISTDMIPEKIRERRAKHTFSGISANRRIRTLQARAYETLLLPQRTRVESIVTHSRFVVNYLIPRKIARTPLVFPLRGLFLL